MSAELLAAWEDYYQQPRAEVLLGDGIAVPASIQITLGLDGANATCRLAFEEHPATTGLRVPVVVRLGYGPYLAPAFNGETETTTRSFAPHGYEVAAAGQVKRLRYQYGGDDIPWIDETMLTILTDLFVFAGVPQYSIDARSDFLLGTLQPIWLRPGQTYWSVVERLAQDWGYKVFDTPDGTVRVRRISGLPAENPAYTITQGQMGFRFQRPRGWLDMRNQAIVSGLPVGYFIPQAIRQDPGDPANLPHLWIPNPPGYIAVVHSSDYLETLDQVEEVALRLMYEHNHVAEEMTLEIPGNPLIVPGQTIAVESDRVGVTEPVNYFVLSVAHDFGANGFTTTLTLRGGIGAPGEPGDPYGEGPGGGTPPPGPGPSETPEPAATWVLDRQGFLPEGGETPDVGSDATVSDSTNDDGDVIGYDASYTTGTRVRLYVFNGDALGSYAPAELPTGLTFAWSNNKNGDTSAGRFYATAFTRAEMETAANCEVYLAVTGTGGTRTLTISLNASDARVPFLAAVGGGHGWISPTGGEDWAVAWVRGREQEGIPPVVAWDAPYWATNGGGTSSYRVNDWGEASEDYWLPQAWLAEQGYTRAQAVYHPSTYPPDATAGSGVPWIDKDWKSLDGGTVDLAQRAAGALYDAALVLEDAGGTPQTGWWYQDFHLLGPQNQPDNDEGFLAWTSIYNGYCCAGCTTLAHLTHNCAFGVRFGKEEIPPLPPPMITATPEINGDDFAIFGTRDGRAVRAEARQLENGTYAADTTVIFDILDYQRDEEEITAIWLNEADHTRVTLGTSEGRLWRGLFQDSAWAWERLPFTPDVDPLGTEIRHLVESPLNPGQYRVSMGGYTFITFDDFRSIAHTALPQDTPVGDARQSALSPFGNYQAYAGNDAIGEALEEYTGTPLTLSGVPPLGGGNVPETDESQMIVAATHHIREGALWASTRYGHVLRKEPDSTDLVYLATIPDATRWRVAFGSVDAYIGLEHMVRDGQAFLTLYAAGVIYLHKSYNGGTTWRKILALMDEDDVPEPFAISDEELDLYTVTHASYGSPEWAI